MKMKSIITQIPITVLVFCIQSAGATYTFTTENNFGSMAIRAHHNGREAAHILYDIHEQGSALVVSLDVEKKHQKNGIGSQLLLRAFDDMKHEGVKTVFWVPTNSSIPFYSRFGAHMMPYFANMKIDFERDGDPHTALAEYHAGKMFTQAENEAKLQNL